MTSNADIARALQELVDLLVLAEGSKQAFRVRAYEKAVAAVHALPRDAAELTVKANVAARTGEEGQEGLGAFLEKRRPSWIKE